MNSSLYFLLIEKILNLLFNKTPLHIACENDNEDIIKLLISKGVDVNAVDKDINTPLHIACTNNNFDIIKLLIDNGAKVKCQNKNNETPLHKACKNSN